jgi:Ulp1 family protease
LTNQEIEQVINRPYNTIAMYRKNYASHTLGVRKSWKPKVLKLIKGDLNYIVAKNFVEQASARVAGYALGKQLKQSRKPSLIYLKLKD